MTFILNILPYLAILLLAVLFTAGSSLKRLLAFFAGPTTVTSSVSELVNKAGDYHEFDEDELAFSEGVPNFQALVLLRHHLQRCKVDDKVIDQLIDPIAPLLLRSPVTE